MPMVLSAPRGPRRPGRLAFGRVVTAGLALIAAGCKPGQINPKGSWLSVPAVVTQHNDNGRTGAMLAEHALTVESVTSGQFMKIYTFPVTGQVYAQPLYVPNVKFANDPTRRNLLVVATMANRLYVFDADVMTKDPATSPVTWMDMSLGTPVQYNYMPMKYTGGMLGLPTNGTPSTPSSNPGDYNIYPLIGVTGTPVVDTTTMRLYVVAKSVAGTGPVDFKLWCVELTTRQLCTGAPVTIAASRPGTGAGGSNGSVTFDASKQHQRAALLLLGKNVYVAFGSHQDTRPFRGWLMSYDATTLAQTAVWTSAPNGEGGAIWQAGSGPAADDQGRIHVMTGNGVDPSDMDTTKSNFAQSFVQLDASLVLTGSFTPSDAVTKSDGDVDLGSAGPVVLPGTGVLVGGGKDGQLYLLDRNTGLGMRQIFQASKPEDGGKPAHAGMHHIHGSPVVWHHKANEQFVYLWPERDNLRVFKYDETNAVFTPTAAAVVSPAETPAGKWPWGVSMPGGILSLSANGTRPGSGLLWASHPTADDALHAVVAGTLRVFDAEDVTKQLWSSEDNPGRDGVGLFAKYTPPTVVNGRVYLATFSDKVEVYGLHQWAIAPFPADGPISLKPGQAFTYTVMMQNTGTTTWTRAGNYRLGSQAPQDNMTWGPNRFELPIDSIAPGETATFSLPLTAPTTPGTFFLVHKMVQDGVEWFGETSRANRSVVVAP